MGAVVACAQSYHSPVQLRLCQAWHTKLLVGPMQPSCGCSPHHRRPFQTSNLQQLLGHELGLAANVLP